MNLFQPCRAGDGAPGTTCSGAESGEAFEIMYDRNNLGKLKKMDTLAPEVMKAFWAFNKASVAEGTIPVKYKELIAVAVAVTTQCPYCIDLHAIAARRAGASEAELAEATMVAAALRAGGAVTHATHALSGA